MITDEMERLVRTRQRVVDHGEVFTPSLLVEAMLNLVSDEAARIESRVLEPACGSGNFLVAVLARKLGTVHDTYGRSDFEKRHRALLALMGLYGIELLPDNADECRDNLATIFRGFLGLKPDDVWALAASHVLAVNIVVGNALTMANVDLDRTPIVFPEWSYLGRGQYQRRDFRFRDVVDRASFTGRQRSLLGDEPLFVPVTSWPKMTVKDLAR